MIVEVGGGVRILTAAGRDLLDGYAETARATAGRGQILVPWPNRLADGTYDFDGSPWQLPLNDPAGRTAMHGMARWLPWRLQREGDAGAIAQVAIAPQPGWPTWLNVRAHYSLTPREFTVSITAHNVGPARCPFGLGMHPYLRPRSGSLGKAILHAPAQRRLRTDDRGLPVEWVALAGSLEDFTTARAVGNTLLDTCYQAPAGGWAVEFDDLTVWADDAFGYFQLFTGDTDPEPTRRRTALAVEPMTCPANAFRSGDGLLTLAPGDVWDGRWGIRFG